MSEDMHRGRCFRRHPIIKFRHERQKYEPEFTKEVVEGELLRTEKDLARMECADAYGYVDCLVCENSECKVMLSYTHEVLRKEYLCDNENSFYFGTRIEKPLKHLEDCMFAVRANIKCIRCTFLVEYKDGILVSRT